MTQPAVNITELDGALGVLPPSAGRLFALVGVSSSGPLNTPASYGRTKDVIAAFGSGPLVEAACHYIERYGRAVVLVRTAQTTAGSSSAVTAVATGTSVVTATLTPWDDYEVMIVVVAGGTIGVSGITFKWSLDGGRTFSPVTALGTATNFVLPGAGGVRANFAAGTLVAGDTYSWRTTAPAPTGAELTAALESLRLSTVAWEIAHIVTPIDATAFDAIDLKFAGMDSSGKYRMWIGNTRIPNIGETEAAYKTALDTIFSSKSSLYGALCAGAVKLTSSVSGRKYKRPVSFVAAAREAYSSEEVNTADPNLPAFSGVSIRDANGNPDEHDESANPGLDDSRFYVLRTHDDFQGVYVNRPRLFSPDGSDFQLVPHRRVMNIVKAALKAYFTRRLNKPVRVSAKTGFILEEEALEIEAGARAVMRAVLLAKPKASAIEFTLSRTDNLLSTKTMTGSARVVPLAYPETINLDVGFKNPALQIQQAA